MKSRQRFIVGSTNPDPVCQWKTESGRTDVVKNKIFIQSITDEITENGNQCLSKGS